MKKLNLTILTPQRVVIKDKKVDSITIPAWEGEMCILYNHMPYITQLREGILKYRDEDKTEYLSIFWGFCEVFKNNVIILAEDITLAREIEEEKLKQDYSRIKEMLHSKDKKEFDIEELETQLKKAIVNLKLSKIKSK